MTQSAKLWTDSTTVQTNSIGKRLTETVDRTDNRKRSSSLLQQDLRPFHDSSKSYAGITGSSMPRQHGKINLSTCCDNWKVYLNNRVVYIRAWNSGTIILVDTGLELCITTQNKSDFRKTFINTLQASIRIKFATFG